MNSVKTIVMSTLLLMPMMAFAGGNNNTGGDSCRGNCPQNGGSSAPVEQTQGQGQAQGQIQGQGQAQAQQAEATATGVGIGVGNAESNAVSGAVSDSNSRSDSDSNASATGGDSTVLVGVGLSTGPTVSGSRSSAKGGDGGDAYASGGAGGDSSSSSEVGDTSSVSSASNGGNSTGDMSVGLSIKGDTVTYEDSASRAATVYSQVCMNGGSAQAKAGGFAISNQDVVCEHLKVAAVMREAYMFEMAHGSVSCQPMMEGQGVGSFTYSDTCMNEKAEFYLGAYHEHMTEAIQAMEMYEEAGLLDKISGALIRPMALIGALIWLI